MQLSLPEIIEQVEFLINATPTGPARELISEANIYLNDADWLLKLKIREQTPTIGGSSV